MSFKPAAAVALAPATLGLLAGLAMELGLLPNAIVDTRLLVRASILIPLAGFVLVIPGACLCWLRREWRRRLDRAFTHQSRAQAEARSRFVHRLNHELKNPLTAIHTALVNVSDSEGHASSSASLCAAKRQVERLSRLIRNLQKLAEIEERELEHRPVDVTAIIGEAVDLVRAGLSQESTAITVNIQQLPWHLDSVQGDEDLLLLAMYNLVDNAVKFTGASGKIEVRASEDEQWTTVEIADTGPGIAGSDLPHVTEELYRGEAARDTAGSGLGLALADRVARLHGGSLRIRSRPGHGTAVALRIPHGPSP